ncbi:response regulator transcription factor [Pseudolactococcus yaeyamensis]
MNLFILEDDLTQLEHLERLIAEYLKEKDYPIDQIVACDKAQNMMEKLENSPQNNIYFLDIAIKSDYNAGLETAQKIRMIDPIGQISFVTTHNEFAPLTYQYKVNAHDFIDKMLPEAIFQRRIITNIEDFFESNQLKSSTEVFTYQTRTKKIVNVFYSDIYFFEVGGGSHEVLLQTKNETITFYGSLKDIEKKSNHLVRIHRDTLVNQVRIKLYLKKSRKILLDDGTLLSVSRSGTKLLKELGKW